MKKNLFTPLFTVVGLFSILTSCNHTNQKNTSDVAVPSSSIKIDTITSLGKYNGKKAVWFHDGIYTTVTTVPYSGEEVKEALEESMKLNKTTACSNSFAGTAREAAKISYASVTLQTYSNIAALKATFQTDAYMRGLGISTASTSNRVTEEKRYVSVTSANLYAISRESDNDFHMIMGDAVSSTKLLNCECSGLPSSSASSYTYINTVRNYIISYFGTDFCSSSGYTIFSPAISVSTLKGSLFFDVDHAAGVVGPSGYRSNTSWEIHPIKYLAF